MTRASFWFIDSIKMIALPVDLYFDVPTKPGRSDYVIMTGMGKMGNLREGGGGLGIRL